MRIDDSVLADIDKRLYNTEQSLNNIHAGQQELTDFHRTLNKFYLSDDCKDELRKHMKRKNFTFFTDYEILVRYRKKLTEERDYVAKKLAAMKKNKQNKEKPDE